MVGENLKRYCLGKRRFRKRLVEDLLVYFKRRLEDEVKVQPRTEAPKVVIKGDVMWLGSCCKHVSQKGEKTNQALVNSGEVEVTESVFNGKTLKTMDMEQHN